MSEKKARRTNLRVATDKRITLLLPGGFMDMGAFEVGFLTALEETEVLGNVDTIVACSVGSLNGVMAATGKIAELREFWLKLKPTDILTRRTLRKLGMSHAALQLAGFAEERERKAKRLRLFWRALRVFFEAREFYADAFNNPIFIETLRREFNTPALLQELVDSSRELQIMTTDFTNCREKLFSSKSVPPGLIEEATIASASIPAFFPPRKIGGDVFVDGGELRPEPLTAAFDTDCDLIVAVRDTSKPQPKREFRSLNTVIQRIFEVDQYERRTREWLIAEEKARDVTELKEIERAWFQLESEIKRPGVRSSKSVRHLAEKFGDRLRNNKLSFRRDKVVEVIAVAATSELRIPVSIYGGIPDFSNIPILIQKGYEGTLKVLKENGLVQKAASS